MNRFFLQLVRTAALLALAAAPAATARAGVQAWGDSSFGQTNSPPGLTNAVSLSAAYSHNLVLLSDGTVVAWGGGPAGQAVVPTNITRALAVAAGNSHSLVLLTNGTVAAWGANNYGQTNVPAGLSNVVALAAGNLHSLALKEDGTVAAWGYAQATLPPNLSNVTTIAAGGNHSLALHANGTVAGWGDNVFGQTNIPAGLSNVVAVAAGYYHSTALLADGSIRAWGKFFSGYADIPSGLNNLMALAAGEYHNLGLRADGSVVAWGDAGSGSTNVPVLTNAVAVSRGGRHGAALLGEGPPFLAPSVRRLPMNPAEPVFLRVQPAGQPPFVYRWERDGLTLEGATGALLRIEAPAACGAYRCLVFNALGLVTGETVRLLFPSRITLATNRHTVAEGTRLKIKVRRPGTPFGTASASYSVKAGTAKPWKDYIPRSGLLVWTNGDSAARTVSIQVPADGKVEKTESFTLVLGSITGAEPGPVTSTTVKITGNSKAAATMPAGATRTQDLDAALGAGLAWHTSDECPWKASPLDGGAGSGPVDPGGFSWLQAEVEGAGTLAFDLLVEGPPAGVLLLLLDGRPVLVRRPGHSWKREQVSAGNGPHVLSWVYAGFPEGGAALDRVSWDAAP